MKVPFFRLKLTANEREAVSDTVESGWLSTGLKVKQFEKKICKYTGAKYAAAVSSGTAGLHLVLKSIGVKPGDEIITTPLTMVATVEAILYCGAKPILVDVDPVTLNIDPHKIENKINRKTRAIVTVDMAGHPCDYKALRNIARRHKLKLVADAAHSLGGMYCGKNVGTLADATVFSFYPTKNITTGEGGMVVTGYKRLADKIKLLSLHAMDSSGWKRSRGGTWRYDITDLGYKYNMTDLAAALGLSQLKSFSVLMKTRQRLAEKYINRLKDLAELIELPSSPINIVHARHLFVIRIIPERWKINRDQLILELEKLGIGCGVHYIPVYRFSYYKKLLNHRLSDFPNTEKSFKKIISLPFFTALKNNEVDYVCNSIKGLTEKYGR